MESRQGRRNEDNREDHTIPEDVPLRHGSTIQEIAVSEFAGESATLPILRRTDRG